ncbi:hypothetical protein IMX26_14470 [Clostridium sp. 'deep sea']|uniref:hypothetical protein n=1 Tax=Clostridium sp. 'deep sea' TaxID=2779445 RepID=UPI001896715F|nr:hypothetical protein [Clostridium sp. 'deep sea']QOR34662.1 hypothetical protein IMX26_14470 [Clostridium sp. 'deep sea']
MDNYKMTILKEKFNNSQTEQQVEGLTLMIEGKIKEVFDKVLECSDDYCNYEEVFQDALFMGLSHIIYQEHNKNK